MREAGALHGNAPHQSRVAVLVVDMINDLEFEGGEALLEHVRPVAEKIRRICDQARASNVPVVYVNDNHGIWRSDQSEVVAHATQDGVRGKVVAERVLPRRDDYFVLKPKHSGFYATPLDLILRHFGAARLVLTGVTADSCVLFTAHDAYVRDYELVVPADAVASIEQSENERALAHMRTVLGARTPRTDELDFAALAREESLKV